MCGSDKQRIDRDDSKTCRIDKIQPLVGKWKLETPPGSFEFRPTGEGPGFFPYGIARAACSFREGRLGVTVRLSSTDNSGGVILGLESESRSYYFASVGGFKRAFVVGEYIPEVGWRAVDASGSADNLQPNTDYYLEVSVSGQRLEVFVDDVAVARSVLPRPLQHSGFGLYAYGGGTVGFSGAVAAPEPLRAFAIMPFKEPYNSVYKEVIRPLFAKKHQDVKLVRADEIMGPGVIINDIRRSIEESHLIIAEITDHNPNVYYELGHAHALKKPTVLLAQEGQPLCFDVRDHRVIMYKDSLSEYRRLRRVIHKYVEAIKRG